MATYSEIFEGILRTADKLEETKKRAAHARDELAEAMVLLAGTSDKNDFPLFVHVTRAYLELKALTKGGELDG